MPELNFITRNPATDAFNEGMRIQQQRRSNELSMEAQRLRNQETEAGMSSRLRKLQVDADYAEPRARAGLRSANAAALNTEMQGFYKSLDLLNAGDVLGAQEVARRTGHELPPAVVNNAQVRAIVTGIAEQAKASYPNRPNLQQTFIAAQIKDLDDQVKRGASLDMIGQRYKVLPDVPPPPDYASTTHGKPPADVGMAEWLIQNRVASSPAEAWDMVRMSRANPMQMRTQIYNNALRATFGNAQKAEEITNSAMQFIAGQGGAAPAPAPAPRPEPPQDQRSFWERNAPTVLGGEPVPAAAAPAQAAPTQPRPSRYREGQTATNPQTGQKIIFRNGQWMPVQ